MARRIKHTEPAPGAEPGGGPWPKHPGIIRYPSLGAFRQAITVPRPERSSKSSETSGPSSSWDLKAGWDGACAMAETGWAEGAQRIRKLAETIRDALVEYHGEGPTQEVAPRGPCVALDIEGFITGDPEHWRISEPQHRGLVKIACSMNALGYVDAHCLERRGAVGLAIAWVLHEAGYEVELLAMKVNKDRNYPGGPSGGQPVGCVWPMSLEPSLCAFWLAHPAAFRRFGFRWIETYAPWMAEAGGYGVTCPESEKAAVPAGALHIKGLTSDSGWDSDEAAIATARELLTSMNLETA